MTQLKIKTFNTTNILHSEMERVLLDISKEGILNYIEIGPGKALTGMVKRTLSNVNSFSINSITDIKNLKMNLKNKKILITGATGGIGNNLVKKFMNWVEI